MSFLTCIPTTILCAIYSLTKYFSYYLGDVATTVKTESLSVFRYSRVRYVLAYILRSCRFIAWFDLVYRGHARDDLLYTYWMNSEAYAVSILKRANPKLKTVSRVHGGDLYKERNAGFLPFRRPIVESLDRIFTISVQGRDYLLEEYGAQLAEKVRVSRLGVKSSSPVRFHDTSETITIASCSSDDRVKRIPEIVHVLGSYAAAIATPVTWSILESTKIRFSKSIDPLHSNTVI